jgi:hypothetical protein
MNWQSSMHAPGEGTRPSGLWLGLNEWGVGSLTAAKTQWGKGACGTSVTFLWGPA